MFKTEFTASGHKDLIDFMQDFDYVLAFLRSRGWSTSNARINGIPHVED